MTPMVSVCIPTYNGAATIGAALQSVGQQRYADFDVLVVDDGSHDDTVDVVKSFARKIPSLRIESNHTNQGLAGNWNRCLDLAEGSWIKFLFQDDLLHPDCLAAMAAASDDVDLVVCHRRARYVDATRRRRREYAAYHRWSSLRRLVASDARLSPDEVAALVFGYPFVNVLGEPVAHLIRREAVLDLRYDGRLIQLLDYEFASRLALRRGLAYVDRALAVFSVHEGATTVRNYERHRFALDVVDPARLAARYLFHPGFEPLRAWVRRHGVDLHALLEDRLAIADDWLRAGDDDERAQWSAVLEQETGLADRWRPPYPPPPTTEPPRPLARARSWGGLGRRALGRYARRAGALVDRRRR